MSFTLVTSYVNYYRTPIENHGYRLKQLQKLVDIGIPMILFITPDMKEAFEKGIIINSSMQVIELEKPFLELTFPFFQKTGTKLPKHRFVPKDTFDYMCYLHSKIQFMHEAANCNPFQTDFFAWCDYDCMKRWDATQSLTNIFTHGLQARNHIYFPGCWDSKTPENIQYYCDQICWRFCGVFFLGSSEAIHHLHHLYVLYFDTFVKETETMVWDVNFWAYLEQEKDWSPIVYKANHDVSLIRNFPLHSKMSGNIY